MHIVTRALVFITSLAMVACGQAQSLGPTLTPSPSNTPTQTTAPTATPVGFGGGELLYSVSDGSGLFELYSTEQGLLISTQQIKDKLGSSINMAIAEPSPSGRLMVLTIGKPTGPSVGYEISTYVATIDLSTVIPLLAEGFKFYQLSWSPDGSFLLGTGIDGSAHSVAYCVIEATTGTIVKCLPTNNDNSANAFWSWDASSLYWSTNGRLWEADVNGESGHYIESDIIDNWRYLEKLSFSPDGTRAAFVMSGDSQATNPTAADIPYTIYVADADLTNVAKSFTFLGNRSMYFEWAPNSEYLYFGSYLPQTMLDANTGQVVPFPSPEGALFCGWAPDGRTIAYMDRGAIYFADAANPSASRQLVDYGADHNVNCAFSPWIELP